MGFATFLKKTREQELSEFRTTAWRTHRAVEKVNQPREGAMQASYRSLRVAGTTVICAHRYETVSHGHGGLRLLGRGSIRNGSVGCSTPRRRSECHVATTTHHQDDVVDSPENALTRLAFKTADVFLIGDVRAGDSS